MRSSHKGHLKFDGVSKEATLAHVYPRASINLVSLGQLCDDGCIGTFNKDYAIVTKNKKVILHANRDPITRLWYTDLNQPTAAIVLEFKPTTKQNIFHCHAVLPSGTISDTLAFLHGALFSPPTSTLLSAINNNFLVTFPGLTATNIKKYLPASLATAKGHLDQQRKNIQSTTNNIILPSDSDYNLESPISDGIRTNYVFAALVDIDETNGTIYTDLTGRFPITSSRGYKYIFVLYDYDSNAILVEPIKSRTGPEIIKAYGVLLHRLQRAGVKPKLQKLDNEASNALREYITDSNINFQLAPPAIHRRNAAERQIRTFKNHFIAGLATVDPSFPLHAWCRLLPQAETSLNLLRASRLNNKLSAHAQLHGQFDYNQTPLAPPGMKVLAHDKPDNRGTYAPHGTLGYVINSTKNHYRCWEVYTPTTNSTRISDTVAFFPNKIPVPHLSSADNAMRAAADLAHALQNPSPAAPFAQYGDEKLNAIAKLTEIFEAAVTPAAQPPRVLNPPVPPPRVPNPAVPPPRVPSTHAPPPRVPPHRPSTHRYPTRARTPTSFTANAVQALIDAPDLTAQIKTQLYSTLPEEFLTNSVIDPSTGRSMEYRELISNPSTKKAWQHSSANEFGRLFQGVGGRVTGTNTCYFIKHTAIRNNKRPTYARFVCTIRPQKTEPNRTRLTVGGNLINFDGDKSTRTADISTAKLVLNSVISTDNAKAACMDVKNFYLGTPMKDPSEYEYMRIPINQIPQEIIDEYNVHDLVHNGHAYVEIRRGMYGLPQAGIMANKQLAKFLGKEGYFQTPHTPGLWKHAWRPISFALVVDDFLINYVGTEHALHLENVLKARYEEVSTDWKASLFCGVHLKWDYTKRTVDLSMPGYVDAALREFTHPMPTHKEHGPHPYKKPSYGAKVQLTDDTCSVPLDKDGILRIQRVVGKFLYYARAVDGTMLPALSTIASEQTKGTEATMDKITQFMNYAATHPDATIRYRKSDMNLKVHSDASYLSESNARSRVGGLFFLGNNANSNNPHLLNGPLLTVSAILKHVMASAAEAEVGGCFVNCREALPLRTALEEMGHKQNPTSVVTDNTTAANILNDDCQQRRSKSIDMRFYWIRDRIKQDQFHISWAPAHTNLGDYPSKHHSPIHHKRMRPFFVHNDSSPDTIPIDMRGCVDSHVKTLRKNNIRNHITQDDATSVNRNLSKIRTPYRRSPHIQHQQSQPLRRTAVA